MWIGQRKDIRKLTLALRRSEWYYKSSPLKVIGQFSHDGIGCKS